MITDDLMNFEEGKLKFWILPNEWMDVKSDQIR